MRRKSFFTAIICILMVGVDIMPCASMAEEFYFDGPPPICPRWAFEPWIWEDYGNTKSSVMELVDTYEAYGIPVGAVIIDSPWEATPGPVTDLEVYDTANEDDWSVRHNLQPGDVQYGDRAYAFTDVPDLVAGAQWIRTANDSKVVTGDVANFVSRVGATVYIAHDERIEVKPDWLDGWEELDEYLYNDEQVPVTFKLFKKDVVGNEAVALGPNTADGSYAYGMYTVIAKPSGEFSPLDDDYSQYNSYRWSRNRYPQAELMIDNLHDRNIRVIMWATGIMNKEAEYYQVVNDNYCYPEAGNCAKAGWWKNNFKKTAVHIDFRHENARNWFKEKVAPVIRDGDNIYMDGWKCDAGANAFYDSSAGFMDLKNYYYASFYRYLKELNPEGIIVSRAYSHQLEGDGLGAAISDSPINWQGDFEGGFQGLSKQMFYIYTSAEMGYGAPGVEVGGYAIPPAACKISKESLIRYAQFGALTPLMENGGTDSKHEPWLHDTETVDIYRYYATLHSELSPYLFSYSVEANQTGTSILRETDTVKAHHKLGEEIFTSIVVDGSEVYKDVYFPAGARWISYWDDADVHAGGQTAVFGLPDDDLNRFPIFIKVGAIVPMNVRNNETGHGLTVIEELEKPAYFNPEGKITLNIYTGGMSSFLYHHPKGDGIAYDDIEIDVDEAGETIDVSSDGQHVYEYILRIKCFVKPDSVTADGDEAFDWFYREADHLIIAYLKGVQATVTVSGLEGYIPIEKDLIEDLVVNDTANAGDWSIRDDLGVGDKQYGDRVYAFTIVPESVAGARWIRTANDSKTYTGEMVSFVLGADATVYIAHDERISQKPDWLDDWTPFGGVLQNDEQVPVQFRLYQKDFGEDDVVGLGPNSTTGSYAYGMYTVIVVPEE